LSQRDGFAAPDLDDLHARSTSALADEDRMSAVVRDGNKSVEVIPIVDDGRDLRTMSGRFVSGLSGADQPPEDLTEMLARDAVRLPANSRITQWAESELQPLDAWADHPWLGHTRALRVVATGRDRYTAVAEINQQKLTVHYDQLFGLMTKWDNLYPR